VDDGGDTIHDFRCQIGSSMVSDWKQYVVRDEGGGVDQVSGGAVLVRPRDEEFRREHVVLVGGLTSIPSTGEWVGDSARPAER